MLYLPLREIDQPKIGEHKVSENVEERIGANEVRNPNLTPDVQAYLLRAYPEKIFPRTLRCGTNRMGRAQQRISFRWKRAPDWS
jgi:hypothetical protein